MYKLPHNTRHFLTSCRRDQFLKNPAKGSPVGGIVVWYVPSHPTTTKEPELYEPERMTFKKCVSSYYTLHMKTFLQRMDITNNTQIQKGTDIHEWFLKLTFRRRIFFQILAHPVLKMWVIQKPNKVALWNKRYFEEKKWRLYIMFKIFSTDICWINIKWGI